MIHLKSIIPPALYPFFRPSLPEYENFEQAVSATKGYENQEIVDVVYHKTDIFRTMLCNAKDANVGIDRQTAQNMFVLSYTASEKGSPLNVLDLGGALGATYFLMDRLLPGIIGQWHIVETAPMVNAGRSLFANHKLTFDDHIQKVLSDYNNLDLIFASGVLQYISQPLEILKQILAAGEFIYLTRTIVGLDINRHHITHQVTAIADHGPGPLPGGFIDVKTLQPMVIIPYQDVVSLLQRNCIPIFNFEESGETSIQIGSRGIKTKMIGSLLRKRKAE